MKKLILFLLVAVSISAKAQTLKELLYGGKLKMDSNSVIRKTDDYKSKIDTGQKKVVAEPEQAKPTPAFIQTVAQHAVTGGDTANAAPFTKDSASTTPVSIPAAKAPARTNNKIWKDYADSMVKTLTAEVLSSKKIRKETYYIMVDYELDVDGKVTVTNVTSTPENSFLQDQVKERLLSSPPSLNSTPDSTNKTKKLKRRYSFTITKG